MVLSRSHVLCAVLCQLLLSVDTLEEVLIEESSSIESLLAPRGGAVELPCDVTPALADDSMALVIWYKQGHDAPIYSVDLREDVASHWADTTLGPRASFRSSAAPAVLLITNLRAEDSGQYRCRVDFSKSPTKNTRLNLTVLLPPERLMILNQEGEEVHGGVLGPYDEGAVVNITCVALGGRPPARVSWWRAHELLANAQTRASASFTLRRADYGTNATCQAVTAPSLPPLSRTVTVDINLRLLRVEVLGGRRPLVAGRSTELECQAVGARSKPNMSWWKGGERLRTVRETISPDGNVTSSILTIVPSIADAGRVLSCRAVQPTVPHSTREDGWKLEIQHLPVVKLELGANLDADTVVESSDVYLDCMVKANPGHTLVYFTHNGVVVKPGPGVLLANQSLVLQHVSRRAAGAYECAARSALGEGASDALVLDVKYAPSCKSPQPVAVRAARGEQVAVDCELDANPREPMTYVWWFNSSSHDSRELAADTRARAGGYSHAVRSAADYGWLQCAGTNSAGRQAVPCVFNVVPAEKPSPVRECAAYNVTRDALRLVCACGHDGGARQAFALQVYDIASGLMIRNLSSDEPSFEVWGLAESAAVRLTVRAYNEKGQSEPVTVTSSLLRIHEKHSASVPVTVELSTVLVAVLCAVALIAAGAALAASMLCCKYCANKRGKHVKGADVPSNKPLTDESESVDSMDKNPDIIPVEGKLSDTCSNRSSATERSAARPLISSCCKYDAPASERYYDRYPFNKYVDLPPVDFRRPYQSNSPMPSIAPGMSVGTSESYMPRIAPGMSVGTSENYMPSIAPGMSIGAGKSYMPSIAPGMSIGAGKSYMPSIAPGMSVGVSYKPCGADECGVPHDLLYEDWLMYRNCLPTSTTATQYPVHQPPSRAPHPSRPASPATRAHEVTHQQTSTHQQYPQTSPQQ